jgi:hypothetical protein
VSGQSPRPPVGQRAFALQRGTETSGTGMIDGTTLALFAFPLYLAACAPLLVKMARESAYKRASGKSPPDPGIGMPG